MKVCHLSSVHPRYDNRILKRECVSLAQHGYDVYYVVNDTDPYEIFNGVTILSTGMSFNSDRMKRILQGVKAVYEKALQVDADVYHLHDPELLSIVKKLKKLGKKVIFDSHEFYARDILSKNYIPVFLRHIIAEIYYSYETAAMKSIDAVIVPCQTDDKFSFTHRAKIVGYVNNYPRLEDMKFIDTHVTNKVKRSICYSGALTYERGIDHIAKAATVIDAKLFLAGNFFSNEFKDVILGRSKRNNIVYEGFLKSIDDIFAFYQKSCIGMCTLLPVGQFANMNNLPTKVYEYMACGLPVIMSDFPTNRYMIEKYQFGMLCNPESVDDIAMKIKYLLDNPQKAEEMGERGRKLFMEQCNWNVAESALLDVYCKVLS